MQDKWFGPTLLTFIIWRGCSLVATSPTDYNRRGVTRYSADREDHGISASGKRWWFEIRLVQSHESRCEPDVLNLGWLSADSERIGGLDARGSSRRISSGDPRTRCVHGTTAGEVSHQNVPGMSWISRRVHRTVRVLDDGFFTVQRKEPRRSSECCQGDAVT